MSLSHQQLGLIHGLQRKAGLDDPGYRLLLRNIAGVGSSKDLTQSGFDEVMASIEEAGEVSGHAVGHYWRDRLGRNASGLARTAHKVTQLYRQYRAQLMPEDPAYELGGLISRFTWQRTRRLEECTAQELYQLIECLKDVVDRASAAAEERRQNPPLINVGARIAELAETAEEPADDASESVSSVPSVDPIPLDDIPF